MKQDTRVPEHTPGPWRTGRPDMATVVDGYDSKWIYGPSDQYVAVASGRITGDWGEVLANARLIASAPRILGALQKIVTHSRDADCGDHCRANCMYCEARAAIAQATGEQA